MIIYPAVDLKDGTCVRLVRGQANQATIFNRDPAGQAVLFEQQGFRALHVVDLDGAFSARPVNVEAVTQIIAASKLPVQLGGGIRSLKTIDYWLARGVERVIMSSALIHQPELVCEAARLFPGRVMASVDARRGYVSIEGWLETSSQLALDIALGCDSWGLSAIVYTDIERDGTMAGHNIDATCDLAMALRTPVIASGGVSSLDDLRSIKAQSHTGIQGVIIGRALYDGTIDPRQALKLFPPPALPTTHPDNPPLAKGTA